MERGKREYAPYSERKFHPSMEQKPLGACFFKDVSRQSIVKIELEDPYTNYLKLFDLGNIDLGPLDNVPREYWPYPNCLFEVLSEPENRLRYIKLKEFFLVLGSHGDISENVGLNYTILHLWKFVYFVAMVKPTYKTTATFKFLKDAGMFRCLLRLMRRSSEESFLLKDYNRYIAYRCMEMMFAASQTVLNITNDIVNTILEDPEYAYDAFYPLVAGKASCMEEAVACQVTANFSCYPRGVTWLLEHPKLVGKIGRHLWTIYDVFYACLKQYDERPVMYVKYLASSKIKVTGSHVYDCEPSMAANLVSSLVLICMCNICATHPDEEPMKRIEPSLLAVAKEGLFDHVGTITYGILLKVDNLCDVSMEKYLSFLSWSCFQVECQKIIIKQLLSLPTCRDDVPLYYSKDSFGKSRSMLAHLITHTAHLDYECGSHFCTLAVVYLLKDDEDVAMEFVRVAGDILFDLSHSIYHAQMPNSLDKPISLKRIILETMLKFGDSSYFSETGNVVTPSKKSYKDPVPECIREAREFCERHVKEMTMKRFEKQKLVRCADEFKMEGNKFFSKKDYYSAIECYTQALGVCPLTCIERRVTYYGNRAECYLRTNQSRLAVRDCTKALAQNPNKLHTRWRRAQAFMNIKKTFPAALDLITIRNHEDESKQFLGERLYKDLDQKIFELMDGMKFEKSAELRNGPRVCSGNLTRNFVSVEEDDKDSRHSLPSYIGKYYHELFGYGHEEYSKM